MVHDDTLNEYDNMQSMYEDVRRFLDVSDAKKVDDKQIIMMVKVKDGMPNHLYPHVLEATSDFVQKVVSMTGTMITWFVYHERASEVMLIDY